MTTLQPKPVRLDGSLSHGDWLPGDTFTIHRQADPPTSDGGTGTSAGDCAAGGGTSGFSNPESLHPDQQSLWALLTQPEGHGEPQDLGDLLQMLASSGELRSAALLRSMERFRDQLDQLPPHAPLDQPVTVAAADLLVLARALMSRLR